MVLVDTSVWIRVLAIGPPTRPHWQTPELAKWLGHELVYGELLIGDRGGAEEPLGTYERISRPVSSLTATW